MRHEHNEYICENPDCEYELGPDHVTLVTTAHVRRFCSLECLVNSWRIATLQKQAKKKPRQ